MNRGNRKLAIFEDQRDRCRFLRIWAEQQKVFGVDMLAGCLMENHFHGVIHTANDNLSEFMQQVQGQFARFSNWRHRRVGHLFQGRFRNVLISDDAHLVTALAYVFMNPIAAGLSATLDGYQWSTYRATAGYCSTPPHLSLNWLSTLFPASSFVESQHRLRRIMCEPKPVAALLKDDELNIEPEVIRQVIRSYTGQQICYATLPRLYRTTLRPTLRELMATRQPANDGQFICDARVIYGYKNVEIAKALKLNPATISKKLRAHQRQVAA
ncbi:MAG TPA: transposase [Vicinamibacterales bacterium]|nr:transposase [Vicinamibacterales bacterium]